MKTRWKREGDRWTADGPNIISAEKLAQIRRILEDEGPIIVERAPYCGGGGREWRLFDDVEGFTAYLEQETFAGDRIAVWSADEILTNATIRLVGKCPDDNGEVPLTGAY